MMNGNDYYQDRKMINRAPEPLGQSLIAKIADHHRAIWAAVIRIKRRVLKEPGTYLPGKKILYDRIKKYNVPTIG